MPKRSADLDFPGADDLANIFQFKRDFNDDFRRIRDIPVSRELNSSLVSFDDWLSEYRDAFREPDIT